MIPWRLVFDIVGFQSTWWASALGAGAGRWEPGVAVAAIGIAAQLALSGERKALFVTTLAAGVMGVIAETGLIASGLVRYAADWPLAGFAPVWLVGLWMVFATCVPATDRMLGANALLKSMLVGAVIAPPTYWAGESFAALSFAEPHWLALAATAVVWAIATPLMILVYRRFTVPQDQLGRRVADRSA